MNESSCNSTLVATRSTASQRGLKNGDAVERVSTRFAGCGRAILEWVLQMASSVCILGLVLGGIIGCTAAVAAVPVEHVLIIGCDGFGSISFTPTNTPVLHQLMRSGSYTLHARGVMPTSSSPNWASMIMGAGPEQHGVTSNHERRSWRQGQEPWRADDE